MPEILTPEEHAAYAVYYAGLAETTHSDGRAAEQNEDVSDHTAESLFADAEKYDCLAARHAREAGSVAEVLASDPEAKARFAETLESLYPGALTANEKSWSQAYSVADLRACLANAKARVPLKKLSYLTATVETCRRQTDDPDRANLEKVAERLWFAFSQHCFPSCETLTWPLSVWPSMTRRQLDNALYFHRSNQVDDSWTHPDPRPGAATVYGRESATEERKAIEIRSASQGRVFAVDFEKEYFGPGRPLDGEPWKLVRVVVNFGPAGSLDRAFALGRWYLWPEAGTDGEEWSDDELALLWSAMPEFDTMFVDAPDAPVSEQHGRMSAGLGRPALEK